MLKNNAMTAMAVRKPIRGGYGGQFRPCRQKLNELDMPSACNALL
jgi:hypothetical protein